MIAQIKYLLGSTLIRLQPQTAQRIARNGMTIVLDNKMNFKDRLIRYALLKNVEQNKDFEGLAEFHTNFWKNKGNDFFTNTETSLHNFFKPNCEFLFDKLAVLLNETPGKFDIVVEIGTGNGDILEYLSSKFPETNRFIGIDLSEAQIERNKKVYFENKKLKFATSDGMEWIKEHATKNTIFFTYGGVLEYFPQQKLLDLFNYINELGSVIFIGFEPIAKGIDLSTAWDSQPYGPERSFSHNYPKLLRDCSFQVWHESLISSELEACDFLAFAAKN